MAVTITKMIFNDDIDLFETDDIDLFGDDGDDDIDLFDFDTTDLKGPTVEQIQKSVENFAEIFREDLDGGAVHATSAAMIMYQHLQSAGFKVGIDAGDKKSVVSAYGQSDLELTDLIADIMESMSALNPNNSMTKSDNNTISDIKYSYDSSDTMKAEITFKSV